MALRVQQAQSERERADAAARNRRVCASCGEAGSADQGIDCGKPAHWLCADCFRGFAKFQLEALETFREHGCRLVCEHCLTDAGSSTVTPYAEHSAGPTLGAEGYQLLLAAKMRVTEREVSERVERETRARILKELEDAKSREGRVRVHKQHIEGSLLALLCPRCAAPLDMTSFDFRRDCMAMMHLKSDGGCGAHFCGWCLELCGDTQAAHRHATHCRHNPRVGEVFSSREVWERADQARMQAALEAYVRGRVGAEKRAGVLAAVEGHVRSGSACV